MTKRDVDIAAFKDLTPAPFGVRPPTKNDFDLALEAARTAPLTPSVPPFRIYVGDTMTYPKHEPQPDPATTFRDDPPSAVCPECGAAATGSAGAQRTCGQGHTWVPAEQRVRTGRG